MFVAPQDNPYVEKFVLKVNILKNSKSKYLNQCRSNGKNYGEHVP